MKISTEGMESVLRYWRDLPYRSAALGNSLTYEAAQYLRSAVLAPQPNTPEGDRVQESLVVGRVLGTEGNALPKAYATFLDDTKLPKAKVKDLGKLTVLYVRVKKRRLVRVAPEIAILVKYSPWTVGTIPVFPSKRQALVVYRTVSREEALSIQAQREKDAPKWRAELAAIGVRVGKPEPIPPKAQATPDILFYMARQEFGGGGVRARKLWKKALKNLAASGIRSIMQRQDLVKTMSDPDYMSWRNGTKPLSNVAVSVQEADKFSQFQDRLNG
jgi:hypothetical protein